MQGLSGVVPDMGRTIASKISAVGLDNASLVQCGSSHVAALGTSSHTGQVTAPQPYPLLVFTT